MKKFCIIISMFACAFTIEAQVYEYKVIASVESIVTSGLGRSRIISASEDRNYQDFTFKEQMAKAKKMNEISQIVLKFA